MFVLGFIYFYCLYILFNKRYNNVVFILFFLEIDFLIIYGI